jgi:hypothetical protein
VPSQVSICNGALIKIGADRISSITENKREAILLNALWENARDFVLRGHRWNFATLRVTLTPSATTPDWGYDYEYELPTNYLRVVETDPDDIDFVIEADATGDRRVLRSDESELDILYIFKQENMEAWDSSAAKALEWQLAAEVGYALTQSLALQDSCFKKALQVMAEARSMDGAEGILRGLEADDWTNARKS